jgi:predicted dehydrogenase
VTACPYDARHIYLNMNLTGWPIHVLTDDLSASGRLEALQSGPYGRCVYTAGSDVVDHQVVAMELASGASASLTMHGHSGREERTIRIDGSRGTLRARFGAVQAIEVLDHALGSIEVVPVPELTGGHGGGDDGSIRGFLDAVRGRAPDPSPIEDALKSHLVAFAAEASRRTGEPIDLATVRERYSVAS